MPQLDERDRIQQQKEQGRLPLKERYPERREQQPECKISEIVSGRGSVRTQEVRQHQPDGNVYESPDEVGGLVGKRSEGREKKGFQRRMLVNQRFGVATQHPLQLLLFGQIVEFPSQTQVDHPAANISDGKVRSLIDGRPVRQKNHGHQQNCEPDQSYDLLVEWATLRGSQHRHFGGYYRHSGTPSLPNS